MTSKIRLYVDHPTREGQTIPLDRDQANYLFNVMRLKLGDTLFVFNSEEGEHLVEVSYAGKKGGELTCLHQTRPLQRPPDLWLLFAPIKKARTDFIVEKAAEMGAARILPVQTDFTNAERIRQDRLQAHAIEAAEQCGGTYVPKVEALQKLDRLLDNWPLDRKLIFCDEEQVGKGLSLQDQEAQPSAILIGPEGGFSPAERSRLVELPFVTTISLGPRILRADTAVVAAMTLWQKKYGDWQ